MQTADVMRILRRIGKSWVPARQQTFGQIDHSLARATVKPSPMRGDTLLLGPEIGCEIEIGEEPLQRGHEFFPLLQSQDSLDPDEISVAVTVDVIIHDGLCAGDRPADGR